MFRLFRKYQFFPSFAWPDLLFLSAGIAAFAGLAFSTVTKFSIWFDEGFGSYLIRFDFAAIARYTSNDVHPPMYYWLLKVWASMFGNTELGIRSMSIFFGAVTLVFTFLIVIRLFGRKTAYVSLLFLVLSPMFIRYSQEARMYTVLTADIVAATYMLIYAQHSKKRWPWITYGVLVAFGMLTQYFTALAWIAHWVWRYMMVRVKGEPFKKNVKRLFSKQWVIAYGTAILLFLPWLPFMFVQFLLVQGNGFWIKPVTSVTLPDFLTTVLFFSDSTGVQSWLALGFYIVLGVMGYCTYKLLRQFKDDDRKNYVLILCMIIVPTVILFLISMPPLRSAFVDRYLLGVVVFMAIFLAINLTHSGSFLGKKFRLFMGLVLVAMMVVGISNQMTIGNYNRSSGQSNNVRQLLEKVRAEVAPGTPIIGTTPWIFYESAIYDQPDSHIYFVNEITQYKYGSLTMLAENENGKIRNLDQFMSDHKTIWMIANLRDSPPRPLRGNWVAGQSIIVNDDLTHQPLFKAVRFTAV